MAHSTVHLVRVLLHDMQDASSLIVALFRAEWFQCHAVPPWRPSCPYPSPVMDETSTYPRPLMWDETSPEQEIPNIQTASQEQEFPKVSGGGGGNPDRCAARDSSCVICVHCEGLAGASPSIRRICVCWVCIACKRKLASSPGRGGQTFAIS